METHDHSTPESPDLTGDELSESDLDAITGGRTPPSYPLPPFGGGGGIPMPLWNEPLPFPPPSSPPAGPPAPEEP